MLKEKSDDLAEKLCEKYRLPPTALSVLHTFLSLDEKSRAKVLDFARRLAADLLEYDYNSLRPYLVSGETSPALLAARGCGVKTIQLDDRAAEILRNIPGSNDDILGKN